MSYFIETQVRLSVTFRSQLTQTNVDPTTVTLTLTDPDGNQTVVDQGDSGIQKRAVGVYYYDWTGDIAGNWTVRWQGLGAAIVASNPYTINLI